MKNRTLLLFAALWLLPHPAFAQDAGTEPDEGSASADPDGSGEDPDESDDVAAQLSSCIGACVASAMSAGMSIANCASEIPECAGLESDSSRITSGICSRARDLVRDQCPPESESPAAVSPAASERPRPRRFELICQNGTVEGTGWRSHCSCGPDRAPVSESRYGIPFGERRLRYSSTAPAVVRVVYCLPTSASPAEVAAARASVGDELNGRVSALEGRVSAVESRVTALESRGATEGGVSEDRVREIVEEALAPLRTRVELDRRADDAALTGLREVDEAMSRRHDAQERCFRGETGPHRITLTDGTTELVHCPEREARDPNVISPGVFGFRLSALANVGFTNLSVEQNSIIPIYFLAELGVTASIADRWYLEGALGFGYATQDAAIDEAFQGQYRIGAMHLFNVANFPMGIAFGGFLSERYVEVFLSGHTLAGGYLEIMVNTPPRGFAGFVSLRGVVGAGFRFDGRSDHIRPDGSIQIVVGIARFGDEGGAASED